MNPPNSKDKESLSERDICTKFITPALRRAGWNEMSQVREEVSFTKGRIVVRGRLVSRGRAKRADYPASKRPISVRDGAWRRLTKDHDIRIFGRAIGMKHRKGVTGYTVMKHSGD